MLPVVPDVTRGKWSIRGNRYFDGAGDEAGYTIILLDREYFVFMDEGPQGPEVFFEKRTGK
jgi:hypothetical protein